MNAFEIFNNLNVLCEPFHNYSKTKTLKKSLEYNVPDISLSNLLIKCARMKQNVIEEKKYIHIYIYIYIYYVLVELNDYLHLQLVKSNWWSVINAAL